MEFEKAIQKLYDFMEDVITEEEMKEFLNCKREDLCQYHFSLGLWLRNNILTENNIIYQTYFKIGMKDKDDMSAELIDGFYLHMKLKWVSGEYNN